MIAIKFGVCRLAAKKAKRTPARLPEHMKIVGLRGGNWGNNRPSYLLTEKSVAPLNRIFRHFDLTQGNKCRVGQTIISIEGNEATVALSNFDWKGFAWLLEWHAEKPRFFKNEPVDNFVVGVLSPVSIYLFAFFVRAISSAASVDLTTLENFFYSPAKFLLSPALAFVEVRLEGLGTRGLTCLLAIGLIFAVARAIDLTLSNHASIYGLTAISFAIAAEICERTRQFWSLSRLESAVRKINNEVLPRIVSSNLD